MHKALVCLQVRKCVQHIAKEILYFIKFANFNLIVAILGQNMQNVPTAQYVPANLVPNHQDLCTYVQHALIEESRHKGEKLVS